MVHLWGVQFGTTMTRFDFHLVHYKNLIRFPDYWLFSPFSCQTFANLWAKSDKNIFGNWEHWQTFVAQFRSPVKHTHSNKINPQIHFIRDQ
uniref:Uncharacterized protein n=1 Tax=Arundo donax TaxID=35708 RepID=A0A0A8YZJ6_ARUDO